MYFTNQRKINVKTFLLLILFVLGSGCATTQMPFTKDSSNVNIEKDGIAIMTLKISNQLAPSYQPNVRVIEVTDLEHNNNNSFKVDETCSNMHNQFNEYLISFQLSEGKYKVGRVLGGCGFFPVSGHFEFPIEAEFEISSNQITYIGYVEMVNRKKMDGETRSGGIFPLIDQAVTGFSGGTFDIVISDRSDEDIKKFKESYPFIENHEIKKDIAVLNNSKSDN